MSQDNIFFDYEGDSWFTRNKDKLVEKNTFSKKDPIILMLEKYDIKPSRILEIGSSNGWRLDSLKKKYNAECVGVEPSHKAVQDGTDRYPDLKLYRGLASKLPVEGKFDLVIASFVFHWISREELIRSMAEIDNVLLNGGFLLISDFAPDVPTQAIYHHLPNEKVYTYKMNYPELFISTNLYSPISRFTFNADNASLEVQINSSTRGECSLLKKSLEGFVDKFSD